MSRPRSLLLTLDAFGTIFYPHPPVPEQYASAAHNFGLPQTVITPERVQSAFKTVFKAQALARPNYGRADVIAGRYGGPRQWWDEVIRGSFTHILSESDPANNAEGNIPDGLIRHLHQRFASSQGYASFEDIEPFFSWLRRVKGTGVGPFDRVVVGIVSNSDDRVPAVLKSLGLRVGDCRADEGVSSMRLPGYEERTVPGSESGEVNDVDLVVTSYEAGYEKPSPRIFEVTKRQAETLVRNDASVGDAGDWTCVHIGDDLKKDFWAAREAGWEGYFLPRGQVDQDLEGVKTIESLLDLIPVLEGYK
ncbi:hypothetical protein BDV25DRAFT_170644 [Aspergillus avenaceus]|uniref:HAD-like domain-containing protein n=1 Tax=Aspergillus avenaceus TaxID=36643 RepID=A0A5N6U0X6_ASPAV|nr:hypothetical protein BDV25DRAFT_170644 [Aspergillus avenaceus]